VETDAGFNVKIKNYKLTWDYGTNMQPNDNKGSITFSEVFLDGKYIGHQFTGTLIRQDAQIFSPQTPE
jgi:hypothetical protein